VDTTTGAPRQAALALGIGWGVALGAQFLLGIPIETYIQLSSGNFLLTYVLIVLTAWRLLAIRRHLAALVISSLAILLLVAAGLQSLWYAGATAALFAVVMLARHLRLRYIASRLYVREHARS
jgi:hypothetical protein